MLGEGGDLAGGFAGGADTSGMGLTQQVPAVAAPASTPAATRADTQRLVRAYVERDRQPDRYEEVINHLQQLYPRGIPDNVMLVESRIRDYLRANPGTRQAIPVEAESARNAEDLTGNFASTDAAAEVQPPPPPVAAPVARTEVSATAAATRSDTERLVRAFVERDRQPNRYQEVIDHLQQLYPRGIPSNDMLVESRIRDYLRANPGTRQAIPVEPDTAANAEDLTGNYARVDSQIQSPQTEMGAAAYQRASAEPLTPAAAASATQGEGDVEQIVRAIVNRQREPNRYEEVIGYLQQLYPTGIPNNSLLIESRIRDYMRANPGTKGPVPTSPDDNRDVEDLRASFTNRISNREVGAEAIPKDPVSQVDPSAFMGSDLLLRARKVTFKGDEIEFLSGSTATGKKSPGVMPGIKKDIAQKIQQIESSFGKKLTVTSGCRDQSRNAAAGGARNSAHTRANAVDIQFSGNQEDTVKLIEAASAAGIGGIGVYRPGWLHLDTESKRVWGPDFSARSIPEWAKPALEAHMSGKTKQDAQQVATEAPTPSMAAEAPAAPPAAPAASAGGGEGSGSASMVPDVGGGSSAPGAPAAEGSAPTDGLQVATASQENAVAERTPMAPSVVIPDTPTQGRGSPGVSAPATFNSPNDPGPVEPADAAERYAKLFNMAA